MGKWWIYFHLVLILLFYCPEANIVYGQIEPSTKPFTELLKPFKELDKEFQLKDKQANAVVSRLQNITGKLEPFIGESFVIKKGYTGGDPIIVQRPFGVGPVQVIISVDNASKFNNLNDASLAYIVATGAHRALYPPPITELAKKGGEAVLKKSGTWILGALGLPVAREVLVTGGAIAAAITFPVFLGVYFQQRDAISGARAMRTIQDAGYFKDVQWELFIDRKKLTKEIGKELVEPKKIPSNINDHLHEIGEADRRRVERQD